MTVNVANGKTSLSSEEVIARAVQFFSKEKFKATSQSGRAATLEGRPPVPWGLLLLTALGFLLFILPGILMYVRVIRKRYRLCNVVVTASPMAGGTEVSISSPPGAAKLVTRFLSALPPLAGAAAPPMLPP